MSRRAQAYLAAHAPGGAAGPSTSVTPYPTGPTAPTTDVEPTAPRTRPPQARGPPDDMLRFGDVIRRTGLSRSTIWRRVRAGTFPAPISLGENSVGWPSNVIADWIASRPAVTWAPNKAA